MCMASQDNKKIMRDQKGNNVKDRYASDLIIMVVLSAQKAKVPSWRCNVECNAQRQGKETQKGSLHLDILSKPLVRGTGCQDILARTLKNDE